MDPATEVKVRLVDKYLRVEILTRVVEISTKADVSHYFQLITVLTFSAHSQNPSGGFHPNPQQPHNFGQPNNFNRGPTNTYVSYFHNV